MWLILVPEVNLFQTLSNDVLFEADVCTVITKYTPPKIVPWRIL